MKQYIAIALLTPLSAFGCSSGDQPLGDDGTDVATPPMNTAEVVGKQAQADTGEVGYPTGNPWEIFDVSARDIPVNSYAPRDTTETGRNAMCGLAWVQGPMASGDQIAVSTGESTGTAELIAWASHGQYTAHGPQGKVICAQFSSFKHNGGVPVGPNGFDSLNLGISDQAKTSGNHYTGWPNAGANWIGGPAYPGDPTYTPTYYLPVLQSFSGWYGDDYNRGVRAVQFASFSNSNPILPGNLVYAHALNIRINPADDFSTAPWAGGQTATGQFYHIAGSSNAWAYRPVSGKLSPPPRSGVRAFSSSSGA